MTRISLNKTSVVRAEFAVAVLLTLVLLAFHLGFFLNAGALWRDEISSLSLATKPTCTEFWTSLTFDPFPAAYFLLLRFWTALGLGQSDLALRGLGLLIGLSLIGALWLTAWLMNKSAPVWALALFSFNPWTLEVGDSLRPYGFSFIWIVLAFASLWRITAGELTRGTVVLGLVSVVLSVQSTFTNAFLVFGVAAGAAAVLTWKRDWPKLALIFAICTAGALSLLLYVPIIQATQKWSKIIGNKNTAIGVIAVARDAIAGAGQIAELAWITLLAITFFGFIAASMGITRIFADEDKVRRRIVFATTSLLVAAVILITFLCAAHYLVFPRYFLAILAIAAVSVDIFWNAIANRPFIRATSLCLALVIAASSVGPITQRAGMRMSNCDQIASAVQQRAAGNDLIIVTSYFYGITFQRYYHGQANWVTVPQLADYSLHRWDLVKEAITQADPVPDLIARAESVLREGHNVFLVGKLGPAPSQQPEPIPPAPGSEFGWQMEPYLAQWKSELAFWLEHHAAHGQLIPIGAARVNPFEQLGLFEISGLRED